MATPFEPEPAADPEGAEDDVLPGDDRLDAPDATDGGAGADGDELQAALAASGPKGLQTPVAGGGLSAEELRSDLAE